MERLRAYLNKELPNIDIEPFVKIFSKKRKIKKGEYLVQAGEEAHFLAFVNKGSFRVYLINKKGDEITTWFGFQNMWVTDLYSYYKEIKSIYYVKALENSEVLIVEKKDLKRLYQTNPEYLRFAKEFAEYGMEMMIERAYDLQALTAEQRYIKLLGSPILKSTIPLKYIATYLGITETSLCRIRKNLE